MDTQFYKCKTCGWYLPEQFACMRMNVHRDPEDFCSDHAKPELCDICGQPAARSILFKVDGPNQLNYNLLCPSCYQLLETCQVCGHFNECEFETNPDPLPKYVRQETRNGNMVIVTDVKNPERIRKFCKNCKCYREEENDCLKHFNMGCSNQYINIITKNEENVNGKL